MIFIILVTSFRFFVASRLELIPDEAYYWEWGRHLSWSYYDHPPMTAWLISGATFFGKTAEVWVRLPAILLGLGLSGLSWLLGKKLFPESKDCSRYSVILVNLVLIFALGCIIITPDTPLVFFCTLTLYLIYEATFNGKTLYWYLSGLTLGLALLSKYTAVLLVPCFGIFLGFSTAFRPFFKKKGALYRPFFGSFGIQSRSALESHK